MVRITFEYRAVAFGASSITGFAMAVDVEAQLH